MPETLKRLLIISPLPNFSVSGAAAGTPDRVVGFDLGVVRVASAVTVTIAALVPDGLFHIAICDEELTPVDMDCDFDIIAITANVAQAQRAIWMGKEFMKRGKTVIMGGPHVSLAPDLFNGAAHSLCIGELEPIAHDVFGDLHRGQIKERYIGSKADLAKSPLPRWDLYPHDHAVSGVVQTSRGCPFECNFCDV
ncbi:MAG: radical SAM protein, partial [Deltaproteobacteria bacterium]